MIIRVTSLFGGHNGCVAEGFSRAALRSTKPHPPCAQQSLEPLLHIRAKYAIELGRERDKQRTLEALSRRFDELRADDDAPGALASSAAGAEFTAPSGSASVSSGTTSAGRLRLIQS